MLGGRNIISLRSRDIHKQYLIVHLNPSCIGLAYCHFFPDCSRDAQKYGIDAYCRILNRANHFRASVDRLVSVPLCDVLTEEKAREIMG